MQLLTNLHRTSLFIHRYDPTTGFQRLLPFLVPFILKIDKATWLYRLNNKLSTLWSEQLQCKTQLLVWQAIEQSCRHAIGEINKIASSKLRLCHVLFFCCCWSTPRCSMQWWVGIYRNYTIKQACWSSRRNQSSRRWPTMESLSSSLPWMVIHIL